MEWVRFVGGPWDGMWQLRDNLPPVLEVPIGQPKPAAVFTGTEIPVRVWVVHRYTLSWDGSGNEPEWVYLHSEPRVQT